MSEGFGALSPARLRPAPILDPAVEDHPEFVLTRAGLPAPKDQHQG